MIKKYISFYCYYLSQYFKMRLSYRKDFYISLIMNIFNQISTLLFLSIIFLHIPIMDGWSLYQVLLIYGLLMVSKNLFLTFFGRLDALGPDFIIEGNLDRLLTRPINPLFLLISEEIDEKEITGVIVGICALLISFLNIDQQFSIKICFILIAAVLNGTILFFAYFLLINSLSFWFNNRFSLMWTFMELTDFVEYPITIFYKPIQFILTWIIPFSLVSYFPAILILNKNPDIHWISYISPLITILFFIISYNVWLAGLRRYESTGS